MQPNDDECFLSTYDFLWRGGGERGEGGGLCAKKAKKKNRQEGEKKVTVLSRGVFFVISVPALGSKAGLGVRRFVEVFLCRVYLARGE